jgi:hypothetical protein
MTHYYVVITLSQLSIQFIIEKSEHFSLLQKLRRILGFSHHLIDPKYSNLANQTHRWKQNIPPSNLPVHLLFGHGCLLSSLIFNSSIDIYFHFLILSTCSVLILHFHVNLTPRLPL